MSGSPSTSGLGSGRRSTARTQSKPKKPTAPPANGGSPAISAWRTADTASPATVYGSPPSWRRQRRTCFGRQPMNDQRPTCWPCSAGSSRKAGPSPRSFRKALTGVSQSSMKLCMIGTRLWSPWRPRVSSSAGLTSRRSATAANQHLLRVGEAQAAGVEQHGEVVEHVGGLLGHALVGLLACRARDLLGLLLDLLADERRVGEELARVAGRLRDPVVDRALEARQRLVRRGCAVAGEKARALARVARGAARLDERQHGVGVAVVAQRLDRLRVAGGRALVPELLARAAEEVHLAGFARALECLGVHVGQRQHLAGSPVLDHAGHEAALVKGNLSPCGLGLLG